MPAGVRNLLCKELGQQDCWQLAVCCCIPNNWFFPSPSCCLWFIADWLEDSSWCLYSLYTSLPVCGHHQHPPTKSSWTPTRSLTRLGVVAKMDQITGATWLDVVYSCKVEKTLWFWQKTQRRRYSSLIENCLVWCVTSWLLKAEKSCSWLPRFWLHYNCLSQCGKSVESTITILW